ncbi:protein TPR1-like [Impatiens glandulifera]|uniref:protein TPR1-like n=1 Tax=Impatiens glandulifera TaxID=253017 RepID=UPI001FB074DC|nr:protein TPR1-like [Impatiens glandulifera]
MTDNNVFKQNLVFLILQFLNEEGFTESAYRLEQESSVYFNMKHFEDKVLKGEWVEVEKYLSRFTKLDKNKHSTKIYFEIRKQKYLETLDRNDKHTAVEILMKDLKPFQQVDDDLYKQFIHLITLSNFRENEALSAYGDTSASRRRLVIELKKLVKANPDFIGKLTFPDLSSGRITTLMNQRHPRPNPDFTSLAIDHVCPPPTPVISLPSPPAPAPAPLVALRARAMPNYAPIRAGIEFNSVPRLLEVGQSSTSYNAPRVNVPMPRNVIVPRFEDETETNQCLVFTLPDISSGPAIKIGKLVYTNEQCGLLALTTTGSHKFWKWSENRRMANAIFGLSQPTNSTIGTMNYEAAICSSTITRNIDSYLLSSNEMDTLMRPQPDSTFAAYHPHNKNIIFCGMQDGHIYIYNVMMDTVQMILAEHEKKVTGLTFSCKLKLMVSSSADAQLCCWSMNNWDKKNSLFLQLPGGEEAPQIGDTTVEFHLDQIRILVSHGTHLAIYNGTTMTRLLQWVPQGALPSPISGEVKYSSDCRMIYAAFRDGKIGIFDSNNLRIICHITPNVYLPTTLLNRDEHESIVLTAHPHKPYQFAIGLSDGSVKIIEHKPMRRHERSIIPVIQPA